MRIDLLPENLTDTEAALRLTQHGLNELPQQSKESFWIRSSKLIKEPMLLLLIVTSSIYLIMGDLGEGLLLSFSAFFVIGISLYQERKSEKALDALRELSSPRALVIRNGQEKRIAARELVPGDLVALHEGDRVPGDGLIVQSSHLRVDESLLTGESFPAEKQTYLQKPTDSISEENFDSITSKYKVYSSTLIISGTAFVRIFKTGSRTEVGKIGKSLQDVVPDELNLSKEIRQIVKLFAWSGLIICSVIIVLFGLTRHNWTEALLVGLATQMSLLPEEFPVVLTLFLALGAWRLSKINVLIRRPGSIERLGAITILCVDKTGTLTENKMTVAQLSVSGKVFQNAPQNLPEDFHEIVEYGILASHRDPFDPMEKAICRMTDGNEWAKDHLHQDWERVRDYPLSSKLLAMSCVWKSAILDTYLIATKGAPEAVIDLCHLDSTEKNKIISATQEMAKQGLRVLGVAKAIFPKTRLPEDQHEFNFEWIGLIGLQDPLRIEVPHAIDSCRNAGIRVIMMTGDYPETALNIAKQAGIETINSMITGSELNSLSDKDLNERLKTTHIFARMIPEQKLRIVKALKNMGHVVGMTGDGVNDAPSLKWADIGIAMGSRGTDVAREASDIVLLDDNFKSIVSGIERGRLIFSNIKKAMSYIVSIHIPIAGLSILPVLLGWPLILFPAHIVFLELIIDPACSLMFESQEAESNTMRTPPRTLKSRLFTAKDFIHSSLQGLLVLLVAAVIYWNEVSSNPANADHARTITFLFLALSNLGLIFADMSGGSFNQLKIIFKSHTNKIIVVGIIGCLFLLINTPIIRILFHFSSLKSVEFFAAGALAFIIFIAISTWNKVARRSSTVRN